MEPSTGSRKREPRPIVIATNPGVVLEADRYCLQDVFSAITGYSPKACENKRARGDWAEGDVWIKADDGHIVYDREGYHRWVEGAKGRGSTHAMDASASDSLGTASPAPS